MLVCLCRDNNSVLFKMSWLYCVWQCLVETTESLCHSLSGERKSEAPELEGLGFMDDPTGLLENLVVCPSSQEIKCVESIAFSSFNPPPGYRR
jgi:protein TIF31